MENEDTCIHEWEDSDEIIDGLRAKRCRKCGLVMHRINWLIFYT